MAIIGELEFELGTLIFIVQCTLLRSHNSLGRHHILGMWGSTLLFLMILKIGLFVTVNRGISDRNQIQNKISYDMLLSYFYKIKL